LIAAVVFEQTPAYLAEGVPVHYSKAMLGLVVVAQEFRGSVASESLPTLEQHPRDKLMRVEAQRHLHLPFAIAGRSLEGDAYARSEAASAEVPNPRLSVSEQGVPQSASPVESREASPFAMPSGHDAEYQAEAKVASPPAVDRLDSHFPAGLAQAAVPVQPSAEAAAGSPKVDADSARLVSDAAAPAESAEQGQAAVLGKGELAPATSEREAGGAAPSAMAAADAAARAEAEAPAEEAGWQRTASAARAEDTGLNDPITGASPSLSSAVSMQTSSRRRENRRRRLFSKKDLTADKKAQRAKDWTRLREDVTVIDEGLSKVEHEALVNMRGKLVSTMESMRLARGLQQSHDKEIEHMSLKANELANKTGQSFQYSIKVLQDSLKNLQARLDLLENR